MRAEKGGVSLAWGDVEAEVEDEAFVDVVFVVVVLVVAVELAVD